MHKKDLALLVKSTLLFAGVWAAIEWASKQSQGIEFYGHMLVTWSFVVLLSSLHISDSRTHIHLYPATKIVISILGIVGIVIATDNLRHLYPSFYPWLVMFIALTVGTKDGWKWLFSSVMRRAVNT